MKILKWLLDNWDNVAVILGAIVALIIRIRQNGKGELKNIALKYITDAEKEFDSNMGTVKFAAVAEKLYNKIPSAVRIFFTKKDIEKLIESTLKTMKDQLKDNTSLQEYVGEVPTKIEDKIEETKKE